MKIAYLASKYPAVSHTFILQEILALRARGVEIDTFSVRTSAASEIIDAINAEEARRTRNLLPANPIQYAASLAWAVFTRPVRTLRAFGNAVATFDVSPIQRVMWFFYFLEAVVLARLLVAGGHQHLHCHFGNNGSNTAWLAAMMAGLPFSMTLHGIDIDQPEKFRLPRKIGDAAFTVCISKFGKARMMHLCPPKHWHKLRVVRCGVRRLDPPCAEPVTSAGRLLCVARLSEEKGHLVLFDALKALQAEGIPFHCTLVGDGPMRAALEGRAKDIGLAQHVTFKGALAPPEVAKCYAQCDAVLLASFGEGIPMVLMEAMSHGRPVVSTRVGGIPELVEHGTNGLVVSPGSVRELTNALIYLLKDPARAAEMGRAALDTVRTRFNLDMSADKLRELFTCTPEDLRG